VHELSIAESILDAVRMELKAFPGAVPIRIGVKIGVLAAVDVEALRFCFDIAVAGSDWPRLELDARIIPGAIICLACGHRMVAKSTVADCELCHSAQTVIDGTDELELDALEVELNEHNGANLTQTESADRKSEDCPEPARAV
jgi:hydrogenase nickel incorporation protein HypA/HybF